MNIASMHRLLGYLVSSRDRLNETIEMLDIQICEETGRDQVWIKNMNLGTTARKALASAEIQTADQLALWSETSLLELKGCGPKTVTQIREALEAVGLCLNGDDA